MEELLQIPLRNPGRRRLVLYLEPKLRFWAHVNVGHPDACWLWTGAVYNDGYGAFMLNSGKTSRRAHRYAFEINRGRAPKAGMQVMHSCDVRLCCNPRHLSEGDNFENMQDCSLKGRIARGERGGNSKWTKEIVLEVRRLVAGGMTQKAAAGKVGMPAVTASDIVRRKIWRHV